MHAINSRTLDFRSGYIHAINARTLVYSLVYTNLF